MSTGLTTLITLILILLVAGRTGYARISERMVSMNIKPKEKSNE